MMMTRYLGSLPCPFPSLSSSSLSFSPSSLSVLFSFLRLLPFLSFPSHLISPFMFSHTLLSLIPFLPLILSFPSLLPSFFPLSLSLFSPPLFASFLPSLSLPFHPPPPFLFAFTLLPFSTSSLPFPPISSPPHLFHSSPSPPSSLPFIPSSTFLPILFLSYISPFDAFSLFLFFSFPLPISPPFSRPFSLSLFG